MRRSAPIVVSVVLLSGEPAATDEAGEVADWRPDVAAAKRYGT